ncbi:MAG: Gfo/Idh/MocA family oxidoreductase [Kiritimatiellae bacterium]|nr:Gfo/Idh/MocA family oxidoreductase [Kiritimatiellia bacterium]
MNIGIIGTGNIAQAHALGLTHMDRSRIRLHGCYDADRDKMDKFVAEYPCKAYPNMDAMLRDRDVDAVVVCLPHGLHAEAGIRCLEAGKHLLVEKPMAPTVAECDALIQAAAKAGKRLCVGHEYSCFETIRAARNVLESGELGRPLMVKSEVAAYIYGRVGTWWMNPAVARGGPGINLGVHQVDAIAYLLNAMPRAVRGRAGQLYPQAVKGIEDYLHLELDFGGIVADCRIYSFLKNLATAIEPGILVMCERGYLRVWTQTLVVHAVDKDPETRVTTQPSQGYLAFMAQFEAFQDYVEKGVAPRATGEYGRAMVKCIETIVNWHTTDWAAL